MPREIELLSPARTAAIGREAILHGADAVYLGAPAFGARAAATNSVDDIAKLCDFAHLYGARVYATVNTILRDDELPEAERMIRALHRVGVDALIVQDLGLLRLDLPPIALHASTQIDTRTPQKARFLEQMGFRQIVLARELSLEQIRAVSSAVHVPLEVFVHGALCVSYSGQCYASAYCFGRSANRGECAQFCRLAFDLDDASGRTISHGHHLLSLRDLNQSNELEALLDAGASSLKIEGRLKDAAYVKNITALYRRRLDAIIARRPADFRRASAGTSQIDFEPDAAKSFNRGFTHYFLHGRTEPVWQPATPKSMGEPVGRVKEVRGRLLTVAGTASFAAGDGLCFINREGRLEGFRVNRAEGNHLYPARMPSDLAPRTPLYRNHNAAFEALLSKPTARRRLAVDLELAETADGYRLTLTDERGLSAELCEACSKEPARTPQHDYWQQQLGRLGDTPFSLRRFICHADENFIPASTLSRWRRELCHRLTVRLQEAGRPADQPRHEQPVRWPEGHLDYRYNVANRAARRFWADHGAQQIDPAYELAPPAGAALMFCRHCLRYSLGYCPTYHHRRAPWPEPWSLKLPDGRRFALRFDCRNCQMIVYAPR